MKFDAYARVCLSPTQKVRDSQAVEKEKEREKKSVRNSMLAEAFNCHTDLSIPFEWLFKKCMTSKSYCNADLFYINSTIMMSMRAITPYYIHLNAHRKTSLSENWSRPVKNGFFDVSVVVSASSCSAQFNAVAAASKRASQSMVNKTFISL